MTLARRIIPCLETHGARVVPRANAQNPHDLSDPAQLAGRYHDEGADELVLLDRARARASRPAFLATVRRIAAQLRIPLAVGGGIRSVEEARALLRAGADKIIVNTAAVQAPQLIADLSSEFGAQAVVLAMDVKRASGDRAWEVFVRGGREATGRDVLAWAAEGANRGAGEILLTSMDRVGAREGFDCDLTAAVSAEVPCSVIASGGAGTSDDFLAVFTEGRADAAMATSVFQDATLSIRTAKQYLDSRGILVRE